MNILANLFLVNKTKGRLPSLPILVIKNDILGKNYVLSVAFVNSKISKELNGRYRGKNRPTNVLAFSLAKNSGELILCPEIIKTETEKFGKNFRELLGFIVIHGMLHLKGRRHGSIMETEEIKYDKKYFGRHRHRDVVNKSDSRRIRQRRKIS